MMQINRNLDGPYQRGVANPYVAHVHPYPTRFHGAIYTRPTFGLPYVRNPASVFKPDDFYEYYGVKGLGSVGGTFAGSSMGNGTVGGNTLGLGATGTPIYYMSRSNPKVTTLQSGLNKVLTAQGYREIPVNGRMDSLTCAALGLMFGKFQADTMTQVPGEILSEAARICTAAQRSAPIVTTQIGQHARNLEANRNPVPAQVLVPQTEVVPPQAAPVIRPPAPRPAPPAVTPPTPTPVPVRIIEPTPITIDIPEMNVSARPAAKAFGAMSIVGALMVVGGAAYYFTRK